MIKRFVLVLMALILSAITPAMASQNDTPFIRMDRDDPEAWTRDLDNVRLITGNLYEFKPVNEKYGIDPNYVPSTAGLSTLNISGSAQFSEQQFHTLADKLRQCAAGKRIVVIDLRRESHGFVNGIPVSWYGSHNWTNLGLSVEEIEADEGERFGSLVGKTILAYGRENDMAINETDIHAERFMTERELVESEGFEYFRLPVQDHTWPAPDELDAFIDFARNADNTWLHFHCQAGKGRTGILMMVYDMMRNPNVFMEDIVVRQTMLGGSYPLYTEQSDNYKVPHYEMKAAMTPLIYEYVQENYATDFAVTWSEWLMNNAASL